jgi:hypothetical protein
MSNLDGVIVIRVPEHRKRELRREAKQRGRSFSEHVRKRLDGPALPPRPSLDAETERRLRENREAAMS